MLLDRIDEMLVGVHFHSKSYFGVYFLRNVKLKFSFFIVKDGLDKVLYSSKRVASEVMATLSSNRTICSSVVASVACDLVHLDLCVVVGKTGSDELISLSLTEAQTIDLAVVV